MSISFKVTDNSQMMDEEHQALQMVVKINPGYREVHQHLARYFRARGNRAQAEWHEVRSRP